MRQGDSEQKAQKSTDFSNVRHQHSLAHSWRKQLEIANSIAVDMDNVTDITVLTHFGSILFFALSQRFEWLQADIGKNAQSQLISYCDNFIEETWEDIILHGINSNHIANIILDCYINNKDRYPFDPSSFELFNLELN